MNTEAQMQQAIKPLRQLALHYCEYLDQGMLRLGDDTTFYKGKGNLSQRLNIVLSAHFRTRDERLAFVQSLFGYPALTSTKQLRVGEALAVIRMPDAIRTLAATWQAERMIR